MTETPHTETPQTETPWTDTPCTETPWTGIPRQRPPWTETLLDRDPRDRTPPRQRPQDRDPHEGDPPRQRAPGTETCWDRDRDLRCEQKHRHVQKNNLAPTSLRAVINAHAVKVILKILLFFIMQQHLSERRSLLTVTLSLVKVFYRRKL